MARVRADEKNKTGTISDSAARVRGLNDAFRSTMRGGQVLVTSGILALGQDAVTAIYASVQSFAEFTLSNDPHEEHDFGGFERNGTRICWKIDYYDLSLEFGSEDPADPAVTTRVLTIMLAAEY